MIDLMEDLSRSRGSDKSGLQNGLVVAAAERTGSVLRPRLAAP